MGVPCVQSFGEAEALCAQLDEAGVSWIFCVCVFCFFNTTFIQCSPLGVLWNHCCTECACLKLEEYFERNLDWI